MKKRILVIEDLPMWQGILKDALEEEGYKVDLADSLEVAMLRIQKTNYHFITIDMQLDDLAEYDVSKLEGWPILDYAKKTGLKYRTPIMVITAFAEDHDVIKGLRRIKYIPVILKKEFKKNVFLETVKRYIDDANVTFFDSDNK